MKINKNILVFDQGIQSLIIGIALFSVFSAVFVSSSLLIYLLCQMAIGFWQVLSALIIVIITRDKNRIQYLTAVFCFFANASLISYFAPKILFDETVTGIIFWLIIPLIYAGWYYRITYKDLKNYEKVFNNSLEGKEEYENILDAKDFV